MASKIIKEVLERKADGQRYVIIPKKSNLKKGTYVSIKEVE